MRGRGIISATITEISGAKGYRLPTVKEWEYAARGGKKGVGYTYSGSNNPAEVSWYLNNSMNKTHAVGGKAPNELGLYDMSGNVWEWTMPTPQNNNIRGGCFSSAIHIAVSQWWYYSPNYKDDRGGFRIARSAM